MKFKTHANKNGDLMFSVFDGLPALYAALAKNEDTLLFDEVSVFVEDGDEWDLLTTSEILLDAPGLPTETIRGESKISSALEEGHALRWVLFSDDDRLDFLLMKVVAA